MSETGWARKELDRVSEEVKNWPAWMRTMSASSQVEYREDLWCRRCGTKPSYKNGVCARCE